MDPLSEPQTIKVEKEKEADSTTSSKTEKFLQQSKSVLENFQKAKYELVFNTNARINKIETLNPEYLSNSICTSKYTYLNAFPKILFEQFSQVGNLYFLFLAILQMLPWISQSGGSPVMLIPLLMVVGVNGFKDFFEDYKRKVSDERENSAKTSKVTPEGFQEVQWKDIRPGDIVKVNKNEYFPSDLLLIYSTNKNGVAYVETKNLDGETNLKYKESHKEIYKQFGITNFEDVDIKDITKKAMNLDCMLQCHEPYPNMYEFEGIVYLTEHKDLTNLMKRSSIQTSPTKDIIIDDNETVRTAKSLRPDLPSKVDIKIPNYLGDGSDTQAFPLEYNNLLLRGSSLKNTDYIFGVVTYAGHYSKIMLNSLNARSKQSKVTKKMNTQLQVIVLCQLVICLVYTLIQLSAEKSYAFYYAFGDSNFFFDFFFDFFSWLLAINNLVPISLLVTMEMIRYCQAFFITNDINLYDTQNRRGAVVQSSGLNEELGQIHYIFTDKTGTLTKNVMQFKYMVIGNRTYGSEEHVDKAELKAKGVTNVDFVDKTLFGDWDNGANKDNISNFIMSLALCHTVIPEPNLKNPGNIIYNASSPDELALVSAGKFFGYEFIERNSDSEIIINCKGERVVYKLLHIFEFSSDRKRMSVVVRNNKTGVIQIITKGADSLIKPRLDLSKNEYKEQLDYTIKELESFGSRGLRTLLIASRAVNEVEYKNYVAAYKAALVITDAKEKAKQMDASYEILENNLILQGATAIEDCLQDNLKETLSAFRSIGIKVFMLTGDHPFTAISIAHSSGLMSENDEAVICDSTIDAEINQKLVQCVDKGEKRDICLVITGNALIQILKDSTVATGLKMLLRFAIMKTKCVICSRVSPKQKADIVNLVKSLDRTKTCLAIGDGANDVNMINVADIGIGIFGNEGQQAARASDYSIGQFSFLKRLMFIHGREAYRKNTFAVCYVLWKNALYTLPIIIFGLQSFLSGQLMYDPMMDTFYNILYTAYPVGWYATADREMSYDKLLNNPKKYKKGMKNKLFNSYVISRWYCYAFFTGLFIYLVHYMVFAYSVTYFNGNRLYDLWTTGASIYTCIVLLVNLKLVFEANIHTIFTFLLLVFSIGTYLITLYFGSEFFSTWKVYKVWNMLFKSLTFWSTLLLISMVYFCLEYGWRSVQYMIEKARKKAKKENQKRQEEEWERKKNKLAPGVENDKKVKEKGFSVEIYDKKYTGYAFSEDVANLEMIKEITRSHSFGENNTQTIDTNVLGQPEISNSSDRYTTANTNLISTRTII